MAGKALNKANLTALRAEVLADLLLEASKAMSRGSVGCGWLWRLTPGQRQWLAIFASALPQSGGAKASSTAPRRKSSRRS